MDKTIQQKSTKSSQLFIFAICLLFRWLNAHLTRTYDNPDEYWQGQEVAHYIAFGYGYLTWEWKEKIRSFLHPMTIACVYKIVQFLGLEDTQVLVAAPRYFQATLAAVADYATYQLAKKVIGNAIASSILFMTLCSWFNFLMAARTLSNSMEMVFTAIALNYWPLPGVVRLEKDWLANYRIALLFALIACVMRPTNGLIWLFLGIQLWFTAKGNRLTVLLNAIVACFFVVTLNAVMDTWLYNDSWTGLIFTPILFFKVNVVNNISLFYGVHTWHWYISQGIPFMMTTMSPLLVYGFYAIWNHPAIYHRAQSLLQLSVWIIVVYSLLPHKEFRFLFPIMPILLIMCAYGLSQLNSRWRKLAVWLLIGTQLPMALYTSLWHQRGVMDVMWWLRDQPVSSVGFLMPCHSTPWYSVLHKSTPMWFLTCEPPLDDRVDEADQFYQNPITYLEQHKKQTSHLVLFDNLYTQLNGYLKEQGFTECQRFFNSHFHDDTRRRGDVVVLCS